MRLFLLLLISILVNASQYPHAFSSVGDEIYENMTQYEQIKDLYIYQDRPELLEAFCEDAARGLKAGFALDKIEDDPEVSIDKVKIKAYAKTLRKLSAQNENIRAQIQRDMQALLEGNDLKNLRVFQKAGFEMSEEALRAFADEEKANKNAAKKKKLQDKIALLNKKNKKREVQSTKLAASKAVVEVKKGPKTKSVKQAKAVSKGDVHSVQTSGTEHPSSVKQAVAVSKADVHPVQTSGTRHTSSVKQAVTVSKGDVHSVQTSGTEHPSSVKQAVTVSKADVHPVQTSIVKKVKSEPVLPVAEEAPEPPRELTELEKYKQSLVRLKEELYALRESGEQEKMACLNDITAINYWMIKVLENEKDACAFASSIKQMKSYDKSAASSCGKLSMRYVEWHGRIKPYAGTKLFQAEANCGP